MHRIVLFGTIFASVSWLTVAAPPDSAHSTVIDTGFRLKVDANWVYVNASVRDSRNHSNLLGLGKEDFLLYEDHILQPVRSCIPAETPFNLLLLMDVSASTSPFMRVLRNSALEFAHQLRPVDRIAIMTFSSRTRLILPPSYDRGKLKSALRFVTPDGATAFYDALRSALATFSGVHERKAIVVFSDGVDNQLLNAKDGSETRFLELLELVRRSDCLIYSVFLPARSENEARHPAVLQAEEQMRMLSAETGGRMYELRKVDELGTHYSEIAQNLRFIYTLAYAPDPSAPAGWHTLKVEVRGHPELSVQARTGYFKKQDSEAVSQKAE